MRKLFISILMMLSLTTTVSCQNVTREGNNFTKTSNRGTESKETKTQYTYTDSKGNVYPVYLSSKGKAFIKKVSKKTGKEYKQYLPEVGKKINPEAYKED